MSIEKRQRKSGVVWYVRLRRSDGSPYSRSFRTRKEADRFERSELAQRDSGAWIDPADGDILVRAWAKEWFESSAHRWRAATAARHELALRTVWLPRMGSRRLQTVRPRDVQAVVNELVGSHSNWTVRGYVVTARRMFADAVTSDLIGRSPFRGINLPPAKGKEKRVLSPPELHTLADEIGSQWRCIVYLSGVLGLRFGEIAALTVGDIDFAVGRVSVSKAVSEVNGYLTISEPKTVAGVRTIDMPDRLTGELANHIETQNIIGQPQMLLFADRSGGPIRRSNFHRRVLGPALEQSGIEGFTFHGLRHSAATQWVAAGIDLRTVQYWLGHTTSRLVLELYVHAVQDETRAAARANESISWKKA